MNVCNSGVIGVSYYAINKGKLHRTSGSAADASYVFAKSKFIEMKTYRRRRTKGRVCDVPSNDMSFAPGFIFFVIASGSGAHVENASFIRFAHNLLMIALFFLFFLIARHLTDEKSTQNRNLIIHRRAIQRTRTHYRFW